MLNVGPFQKVLCKWNVWADDDINRRTYSHRNKITSHSVVVLLMVNNEHMCLCWQFVRRLWMHQRRITQSIQIHMNQSRTHINTAFHSHCDLRAPTMTMTQYQSYLTWTCSTKRNCVCVAVVFSSATLAFNYIDPNTEWNFTQRNSLVNDHLACTCYSI